MCQKVLASLSWWTRCMCCRTVSCFHGSNRAHTYLSRYAGYANSVIGSIVANQGFINQYGTIKDPATGKLALNATHIALWGALYFVTCIAIQLVAPTTADRYGRKFNMWGITVFIGIVSRPLQVREFPSNESSPSSFSASPKHGGRSSLLEPLPVLQVA